MLNTELISVIIPVYNLENYVRPAFHSIVSQTYKNLEIIVVNDGSTDNSLQIIKEFAKADNRIKIINKVNGGISSARNAGLDAVTGKYVCFLDGDDFMNFNAIENMYASIKKYGADISVLDFKKIRPNYYKKHTCRKNKKHDFKVIDNTELIKEMVTENNVRCMVVWGKLYKTSIIKENNIRFDESIHYSEDVLFNYEYYKRVKVAVDSSFVGVYYVQRSFSLIHMKFSPRVMSSFNAIRTVESDLQVNFPELTFYLRTWEFYQNLDVLYKMWLSNHVSYETIEVAENLIQALPYFRKNKRVNLFRKIFAPIAGRLLAFRMIIKCKKYFTAKI